MSEKAENLELIKEIQHLREELNNLRHNVDTSYYSIPKSEFETVTVTKISNLVTEHINKRVSGWRNWAALVILLLSFFGVTQGSKLISPMIESEVKKQTLELEAKVTKTLDELDDLASTFKREINLETERNFSSIREEIKSAQITAIGLELNSLINKVDVSKSITYAEGLKSLKLLAERAFPLSNQALSNKIINYLVAWTYSNRAYEELDKLRAQYENKYEFSDTTWANIAIGGMLLYEESNAPIYKARTLSAIENALNVSPNYGEPSAFRLILHMIDYVRVPEPDIKRQEKQQALALINTINAGSVKLTPYETYNYLSRSRNAKVSTFVNKLFELFPEQMLQMEMGYNEYYKQVYGGSPASKVN